MLNSLDLAQLQPPNLFLDTLYIVPVLFSLLCPLNGHLQICPCIFMSVSAQLL
jgi:hypothetical protein